ncbi:hypothetical protein Tco_0746267, partial [Tanacetum coccineum]
MLIKGVPLVDMLGSQVAVPLPDDPYVAVRHAQLVDTDTKSDPKEAPSAVEELQSVGFRVPLMGEEFDAFEPIGTRTDSPHSSASSDSTTPLSPYHPLTQVSPTPTPTRVSFHRRTARMAVRTQPTLSPGMSARIAEAAALSPSSFRKRYRSSYETSSSSSPTLPERKRYRGTSELILDTDSEGHELGEEDTEEDESLDADDKIKSQGLDDEGHGLGDGDHGLGNKSQGLKDEGLGLEEEETIPEGQHRAVPVVETATSEPLGLGYGALRRRELAVEEDQVLSTFEVGQSSRSVRERQEAKRVSAFRQPTLVTWVDPEDDKVYTNVLAYAPPAVPIQTSPSPEWSSDIDRDVRELYTRSGVVRDEIFSQRYMFISLEREQERTIVTFGALWRPVLALEAWAGHVDTRLPELQEMRGRVAALEQERGRREPQM